MFTIGDSLYRLTPRDLEQLLVDPYFRTGTGSILAGVGGGSINTSWPDDRMLWLHSLQLYGDAHAAGAWTNFVVQIFNKANTVQTLRNWSSQSAANGLVGDANQTPAAGTDVRIGWNAGILIPPGCGLSFGATRTGTVNAATFALNINGYLLPAGNFGRAF